MGATTFYFTSRIKPILISELNKSLAVEVNVADISLSSLKSFPKLGLTLEEIKIEESTSYYNSKLVSAKELNLFVNIWKIYKGEYVIDAVTLKSGQLNLADLKDKTNYDILTPSNDNEDSEVSFEIKKLTLLDCELRYEHAPTSYLTTTFTPYSSVSLKYKDDLTFLGIQAQLENTTISYAKDTFVSNRNLVIRSDININAKEEVVTLSPSKLDIEKISLSVDGKVSYGDKSFVDIKFGNESAPAEKIVSILPTNMLTVTNDFQLAGDIELNGFFKGQTSGNSPLAFGFDYSTENLDLAINAQDIGLKNITSKGTLKIDDLENLATGSASCTIQSSTANTGSIFGRLAINDFTRPIISWEGETDIAVKFLTELSGENLFNAKTGRLITDGTLNLIYIPDENTLAYNSLKYAGNAELKSVSGSIEDYQTNLKEFNLKVSTSENDLIIQNCGFSFNDTKGSLNGRLVNYRSLFNKYPNATLEGALTASNLNLNDFISEDSSDQSETTSNDDISPIKLNLEMSLTDFRYNSFEAEKLKGKLLCDRKELVIPKCDVKALEGNTIATLKLKKWGEDYLLDVNSELDQINISELFRQFNNFEQNEITDQNLSGRLSGSIIAKVILDKDYNPILPKLYAKAKVKVDNGALIDYEPLQELSTFVNVENLRNVKFKTLENEIEIFDQTIFIPNMLIQNSALNLNIEGTHTFENYMRYNMGLSVAELLATKAKWIAKKNEKRIERNTAGGLTAYIIMEGTPDDLSIKYDRATVKDNVKQEVKKEKAKFINALKGEGSLDENSAKNKNYDDVWDE